MENQGSMNELRKEVEETKPEQIGKVDKIGKEEALLEAEYIFRKGLQEGPKSQNPMQDLTELFAKSFQYLSKVGFGDQVTKGMFLQKIRTELTKPAK